MAFVSKVCHLVTKPGADYLVTWIPNSTRRPYSTQNMVTIWGLHAGCVWCVLYKIENKDMTGNGIEKKKTVVGR